MSALSLYANLFFYYRSNYSTRPSFSDLRASLKLAYPSMPSKISVSLMLFVSRLIVVMLTLTKLLPL
jgi:hypothetical protein